MPKESKKMTFHIEEMHCVSCSILINKILGKEKGVNAVNANFGSEMLAVDYDEKTTKYEYDIKSKELHEL